MVDALAQAAQTEQKLSKTLLPFFLTSLLAVHKTVHSEQDMTGMPVDYQPKLCS